MKRELVVRLIQMAFQDERYPTDQPLFIPSGGHIFDVEEAVSGLTYEHWSQIPLQVLIRNRDRMTYLTEAGFRFLLPAFLTNAILYPTEADVMVTNIVTQLIPPNHQEESHDDLFSRQIRGLSVVEAGAILAFFESFTDIYPNDTWSFGPHIERGVVRAIEFWQSRSPDALIPDYLSDTYRMLRCAFPGGVPDDEYWPLMAVLHPEMSFRTLARVLSVLTDKEYIEVMNDASGFGIDPLPDASLIERVIKKLTPCGYEQWLADRALE